MASLDISQLRNVTSDVIRHAEKTNSKVYNVLGDSTGNDESFKSIFSAAVDNIKWALGQTENTHDLSVALQKAQMALQYTVAIRDRAMSAYRELTQMQI